MATYCYSKRPSTMQAEETSWPSRSQYNVHIRRRMCLSASSGVPCKWNGACIRLYGFTWAHHSPLVRPCQMLVPGGIKSLASAWLPSKPLST